MTPNLCRDCRFFVLNSQDIHLSRCVRSWQNLISGTVLKPGGDGTIPCWHARKDYCGTSGVGFEPKESPSTPQ